MSDLIGQTIGQYRVIEQIGEGGMATIYKSYQPSLNRFVALKVLPPFHAKEPGFSERFRREAEAIANLHHRNILPVYDFGQDGDYSFIVMRYIEGAYTLKDEMADSLDLPQIADLIGQIAAALDHAHQHGVIHRDVKPGNVLIDGDWALLTDFGLAKMTEASVKLTGSGVGVGTPEYMSPEQAQGLAIDHRTDVYSLGIILFEMLTGKIPHQAETPFAILVRRLTEPLTLPSTLKSDIPEAVEQVILKALARDPKDRFASAGEMAEALEQAMNKSGVYLTAVEKRAIAQPETPPTTHLQSRESAMRVPLVHRWRWIFGVGAIAAVLVLLTWVLGQRLVRISLESAVSTLQAAAALPATTTPATPTPVPTPSPEPTLISTSVLQSESVTSTIPPPTATSSPSPEPTHTPDLTATAITQATQAQAASLHTTQTAQARANTRLATPIPTPVGAIIFASNRDGQHELYSVHVDGTGLMQLTNQQSNAQDPACAIGNVLSDYRLAFNSHSPDRNAMYLLNYRTRQTRRIGDWRLTGVEPAWSPDGTAMAYASGGDIYRVQVDGTGVTALTDDPENIDNTDAAWSPDGSRIAFSSNRTGRYEIYVMSAQDGSNLIPLTSRYADAKEPAWAPDGKSIAFYSNVDGDNDIYVLSFDTGQVRNVTNDSFNNHVPEWSPDGRWISFDSTRNGNYDIYYVSLDGRDLRAVTNDPADDSGPCWYWPVE